MKRAVIRLICIVLTLAAFLATGACNGIGAGESSSDIPDEKAVVALFERAEATIRYYTYKEEAYDALDDDFGGTARIRVKSPDGSLLSNERTTINNEEYYKTALTYQQAADKYSEVFTGEVFDNFMERYFYDLDGTLYVKCLMGMTGFDIENLSVTFIGKNVDEYLYRASYKTISSCFDGLPEEEQTKEDISFTQCDFSVKSVNGEYKISSIDCFDSYRKY